MKDTWLRLLTVLVLLSLVSCANGSGIPMNQSSVSEIKSEKLRVTTPTVDRANLTQLASGNSAFAFDLYQSLRKQNGNLFYSPYSISLALAMTYAGARGETAQQMSNTLHYTLPQDRLHSTFNGLDLALANRGEGAKGKDGKGFRLNIVNAIWGQDGYKFLPDYLNVLAENYGAGLRILNFSKAPDPSRITINNWVSDQTEGKIKDLIPPGAIDAMTRLVLTNAIYFNAAWLNQFNENGTKDAPFTLLDNSKVTVPMMHLTKSFAYAEGKGYQAVELPYDGSKLAMTILLPSSGQFDAFEKSLDSKQVDTILKNLQSKQVELSMPKFKYESSFELSQALKSMGMTDAFSSNADFSGMNGNRELAISAVIHKAFVDVDENGTEAAAATAVVMRATAAMPQEPVKFTMDRPFIFLIRDIETGTILFVGRVLNPKA